MEQIVKFTYYKEDLEEGIELLEEMNRWLEASSIYITYPEVATYKCIKCDNITYLDTTSDEDRCPACHNTGFLTRVGDEES